MREAVLGGPPTERSFHPRRTTHSRQGASPRPETVTVVPCSLDAPVYAGLIATIAEIAGETVTAATEPLCAPRPVPRPGRLRAASN